MSDDSLIDLYSIPFHFHLLMGVQTCFLHLLSIISFPHSNSAPLAFLAVMRIRYYDMDNSMGTCWNSNHSRPAQVPVWRILRQTATKGYGEI
jgi:hypothetical protein